MWHTCFREEKIIPVWKSNKESCVWNGPSRLMWFLGLEVKLMDGVSARGNTWGLFHMGESSVELKKSPCVEDDKT